MTIPLQDGMIGAYHLLNKIGEGGMGAVYLAEHALLGRRAAIKVLLPSLSTNEEVITRFFNEARVVALVSDPGIVQIFDFGFHTDGRAFIVMELLDGESMDRRLKRIRRFAVLECLRLMQRICTALGAAHARGIIHRDLKPGNLFLVGSPAGTGTEHVKILDFGIAKLSRNLPGQPITRAGVLMGTPAYMSPEQCRAMGDIDSRSDIYSIACVMFAMLTGQPPFGFQALGDLVVAHLREPAPLASSRIPGIPGIIDHILQRCLNKSPAERFQSMAELVQAMSFAERALASGRTPAGAAEPPSAIAGTQPDPTRPGLTTLNAASAQYVTTRAVTLNGGRRRQLAGIALGGLLLGSTGAFVMSRRGGDTIAVAPRAELPGRRAGNAPRTAPATPDAKPAPAPAPRVEPRSEPRPGPAIEEAGSLSWQLRAEGSRSAPAAPQPGESANTQTHRSKTTTKVPRQPRGELHASPAAPGDSAKNVPPSPEPAAPAAADTSRDEVPPRAGTPADMDRSD